MAMSPPIHRPKGYKPYKERQKDYDTERGSASSRGYNYKWKKARTAFLKNNPLCVLCKKQGIVTAANEVDHIIRHQGNHNLFWDQGNWQALCKSCHSKKTVEETGCLTQ